MSGETTHYKFKYATAIDETKAFPAAVDQPSKEAIDTLLFEKNLGSIQMAAGATYGAETARTSGTEYEPSATRPTFVALKVYASKSTEVAIFVGGVHITNMGTTGTEDMIFAFSFIVPAGVKWKVTAPSNKGIMSSYLTL